MPGIGKKSKRPSHQRYNDDAKMNGWNGKKTERPKGKACNRHVDVDSFGFWNKGLPEKDHVTKADHILFDVRLKKGLNPFTGEKA